MNRRTIITGTGHYVPPRIVTNFDLEKLMSTSDEWIQQRTGIKTRHHVEPGVGSSDLGVEAAARAIAAAGIDKSSIDFLIAATVSPDYTFPGIGVQIGAKLGIPGIGALDVRNQCTGFIYGLSIADQYIRTGMYKRILLVASEVQSTNLNYSDDGRDTAVLFGDGAAAVICEPHEAEDGRGLLSTHLWADGRFVETLWQPYPTVKDKPYVNQAVIDNKLAFPRMDGKKVFVNASERMPEAVMTGLTANGLTVADIDLLIPHQANDRISQMVAKKLQIPLEKVVRNIDRYGNTTAASIPLALDECVLEGRVKPGDLVVLASFGSGFTWASAVLRW
ncbi:MAG: ketoacyl-ACP synthase III [Acidobacteriota bacterium]|nr:ketoacyl-ACP synthase III [Acidobacteriota bacterium]